MCQQTRRRTRVHQETCVARLEFVQDARSSHGLIVIEQNVHAELVYENTFDILLEGDTLFGVRIGKVFDKAQRTKLVYIHFVRVVNRTHFSKLHHTLARFQVRWPKHTANRHGLVSQRATHFAVRAILVKTLLLVDSNQFDHAQLLQRGRLLSQAEHFVIA